MKNIFSKLVIFVVISTVFIALSPMTLSATESHENKKTVNELEEFESNGEIQPHVAPVVLWLGGVAVGYVATTGANATIEYYTGTHPEEFAQMGVAFVESNIIDTYNWLNTDLHQNIYITSSGSAVVNCPPQDTCPITPHVSEEVGN